MTTEQLITGLPSLLGTLVGGGIVLFGNYLTAGYQARLWERQMVLTAKRKLYDELLTAIRDGGTALTSLELRLGHVVIFADLEDLVQRILAVYDELDRLGPTIQIFSGPRVAGCARQIHDGAPNGTP